MKRLIIFLVLLFTATLGYTGTVAIQDEGGTKAWGAAVLNCTGDGLECSKTGIVGTIALDIQTLTGPLCFTDTATGGIACLTFTNGETLTLSVNSVDRQDWTTTLVTNNLVFVDGNNFVFVDGNNFTFID